MALSNRQLLFAVLLVVLVVVAQAHGGKRKGIAVRKPRRVTSDARSLIIDGKRELLFSGSIHYPRSTPDMWPTLLRRAKEGGLNVIQTYVFWNIHEPVEGQYNFTGNYDLVRFIKLIQKNGMYCTLRLGPFIQAEWNHGGLPYWLRTKKDIIFRNDNAPFKYYMQKWVTLVINMMKKERLYASQGGPIILSQIENEYNHVQLAYDHLGTSYIQWAANMALGQKTGVPWVMCKQKDAPGPVINTCNGRHCGDTFTGPNRPDKPALWTENWTAQFRVFGDPPSQRSAEDIAYSVARWFARNGSLVNYYMYHGGTNFGRTGAAYMTTRYYDEAPLDEFGMPRGPKYGHLKDLHAALKLARKPLLWGTPRVQMVAPNLEITTFEKPGTNLCAAFLTNNDTMNAHTIPFRGAEYFLPHRSISILPDCKTVVYNTFTIVSQHSERQFLKSATAHRNLKWKMSKEIIPTRATQILNKTPLELFDLSKDTSDYAWYTTSFELSAFDLPMRASALPVLRIASLGHALLVAVNGEYIGSAHGSHVEKEFVFQRPVKLRAGINHIAILGILAGFPDSGAYMEHRFTGPRFISILGLNAGTIDISLNNWGHQVGVDGERAQLFTEQGSSKVRWTRALPAKPLTWYKAYFNAPEGNDPLALNMSSMGKGMAWVNGRSIGRYWQSYLSPLGRASQEEYHVPRSFLKPKNNLLVIFEEEGGNPAEIDIMTVNRNTICSFISEVNPPHVKSWARRNSHIKPVVEEASARSHLRCPEGKVVVRVDFASFGNPSGVCGKYKMGNCNAPVSRELVEKRCLGKPNCSVGVNRANFIKGRDACAQITKTLAIQVRCGFPAKPLPSKRH
uniref:Beta-galactosidase n=1 Tax=Kalanchoe fedtschenkoi TaxID=63787 RepID=A0A7N0U519_KALFE